MEAVTTRKIVAGLVLLIAGLVITYFKGDIPVNLLSLMQLLYGAFVAGNLGEHATNAYVSVKTNNKESSQNE